MEGSREPDPPDPYLEPANPPLFEAYLELPKPPDCT